MKVLLIVLLAGLAAESSANLFCKSVEAIKSFKMKEFAGTWYEFKWYSNLEAIVSSLFEKKCSKQSYEYVTGEIEQLFVTVTETNSKGNATTLNGIAVYKDNKVKNGDIKITVNKEFLFPTYEYKIMAYHPGKYCIVYSCFIGIESAVVLASAQHPSAEDRKQIEEGILEAHKRGAPAPEKYKEHKDEECKSN